MADRKSTRLNSSHSQISYAVFCLKKKKKKNVTQTLPHAETRYTLCRYTCAAYRHAGTVRVIIGRVISVGVFFGFVFFFLKDRAPTETSPLPPPDPFPI